VLPQHSEHSEKLNSAGHRLKSPEREPQRHRASGQLACNWNMALPMEFGIGCRCKKILGSALVLMADLTSISLYPVPSPKSRATLTSKRTELSAEPGGRAEHSHEKETQDRDAMSRDRAPGVANWPWPRTRPSISASRWSAAASIKERMGKVENPRVRQNLERLTCNPRKILQAPASSGSGDRRRRGGAG